MNEDDAREQVDNLNNEIENVNRQIRDKKAEAEWAAKMVAQWKADSEDQNKPETVRAEALAELDNEQGRLDELNAFITNVQNRQTELTAELKTQRGKQDEAATFLAEAEEKRAKQQMAEQQA